MTNSLEDLDDGSWTEALLLNPHGKIQAYGRVININGTVYLDYEPQSLDLFSFFTQRVFATQVEILDLREEARVVDIYLESDDESIKQEILKAAGLTSWPKAGTAGSREDLPFLRIDRPLQGLSIWFDSEVDPLNLMGNLARQLSEEEHNRIRADDGLQRMEVDFPKGYLPQEASLERAVHFKKGCYLGQEAVAMAQRGKVKRKLRRVVFSDNASNGDLILDGTKMGEVTTYGHHFGIATVSTAISDGSDLILNSSGVESKVTVQPLPGTVEGPSVPSARAIRESLRGSRK